VSFSYSDMDQLVLQRWTDVVGLLEAHRGVQDRIEEMIEVVGERVARWARPLGFRKTDAKHPYQWVYIEGLSNYRMKEPERIAFAGTLRSALGDQAKSWEADGVDDTECPLGRYVTGISNIERAQLVSSPEALFAFVVEQYPRLFALADVIDAELKKLDR